MKRPIATALLLFIASPALANWSVMSPDATREIQVRQNSTKGLEYRILLHGKNQREILGWSHLGPVIQGFQLSQNPLEAEISDFSTTVKFLGEKNAQGKDEYTLTTGKRKHNIAAYRALTLSFSDMETAMHLDLELRAYNDGLAFRYVLPETSDRHYQMVSETTAFNVGQGATFWGQPYDFTTAFHPSYETAWLQLPSGSAAPQNLGVGWGFPSLIEKDGAWALLHEAGLDESFHGSHLQPEAEGGNYRIAPPSAGTALGHGMNIAASTLPWQMPWRFVITGEALAEVVESNLTTHLAPPARIENTDWIEPGISSWSWLSDHDSSRNLDTLKKFIDTAAAMGWRYSLIDANWNTIADDAMEQLLAHAEKKNVRLLFWYNSGGRHNFITEQPRNRITEREKRRAEFARLHRLGVAGIKVDFFQSDKQDIIRLYQEILADAADFQLLVNFHGSTIPRGWRRTWPNLISMEAVRGGEFYTFQAETDYDDQAPRQNSILPFARNVIGPMDYTPGYFSQPLAGRKTTSAHEAALLVLFETGIQHIGDSTESLLNLPDDYRDYLRHLPSTWDETHLLAGYPGEHAVIARRSGRRWYIAGINGEAEAKTLQLNISQLGGLADSALMLHDDSHEPFAARKLKLESSESLTITMAANGGVVLRF
ncbi:glycoside hydrolase family 97 catalytic domain-containing protein [Microbulbifer bruguierae]|uniref:Glycoside hydrolase family 97 catalytic domain-containing protein n=1 Tax=Microbulbifer bruguierae TaxID=3029061 RepID=A0ABY8NKZ3_9GAMM|nr:glycoside hydrolase family 97 protein [Microbulbifer bruguierae]WGL18377.1 glycoside hydrolase family 97 catalytic domain-containing protein [Microbulbifer bruguierae]